MAMSIEGIVAYFNGRPAKLKAERDAEDAAIAARRQRENDDLKAQRDAEDAEALELLQGAQSIQQQLAAAALPQQAAA